MIVRPTLGEVFGQLAGEGFGGPPASEQVRGALDAYADRTGADAPWYVRVLVACGAWLAATLFVAFLGLTEIVNDGGSAIGVGVLLLGAAQWLRWSTVRRYVDFVVHLALALSVAGHLLVLFGVAETTDSELAVGVTALALASIWLVTFPDTVHRSGSAFLAGTSVVYVLYEVDLPHALDIGTISLTALAIAIWLQEARLQKSPLAAWQAPVGFGLVGAILAVLLTSVEGWGRVPPPGVSTAVALVVLALIVEASVAREKGLSLLSEASLAAAVVTVLLGVATREDPGVLAAVLFLLLAVHRRNVLLLGVSTAFLIVFLIVYYARMDLDLLDKSLVLMASGAVLLLGRFYLRWRFAEEKMSP